MFFFWVSNIFVVKINIIYNLNVWIWDSSFTRFKRKDWGHWDPLRSQLNKTALARCQLMLKSWMKEKFCFEQMLQPQFSFVWQKSTAQYSKLLDEQMRSRSYVYDQANCRVLPFLTREHITCLHSSRRTVTAWSGLAIKQTHTFTHRLQKAQVWGLDFVAKHSQLQNTDCRQGVFSSLQTNIKKNILSEEV